MKTIEEWRQYIAATRADISTEELETVAAHCLAVDQAIAAGRYQKRPREVTPSTEEPPGEARAAA